VLIVYEPVSFSTPLVKSQKNMLDIFHKKQAKSDIDKIKQSAQKEKNPKRKAELEKKVKNSESHYEKLRK
jgi:hypothetical protein